MKQTAIRTAFWLPPLYFAEGLPAAVISEVSLLMFYCFGMDKSAVAFWTNFLGLLPLIAVKLLCGPSVDALSTRRRWIIWSQAMIAGLFLIAAVSCHTLFTIPLLLSVFFIASLTSGVHDIAADGFYILALDSHEQALYSGLRSVFYRVAMVVGSGGLVLFAGLLSEPHFGNKSGWVSGASAWSITMALAAVMMAGIALFSCRFLPMPASDHAKPFGGLTFLRDFGKVFITFFQKKHVVPALLFLLLYRLGEAQLGAVSKIFLLDAENGCGLTTTQYGTLVGTVGIVMMLTGGVLAGFLCAKTGMKKMLPAMVLAINLPDALYLMLAFMKSPGLITVGSCVAVEQFGYGFGFTGYMLFMVWFAGTGSDDCRTSHFALMTLFMIAGLRLPGMPSGWIAEHISEWIPCSWSGYQLFFVWVLLCTLPGYAVTAWISRIVDPAYGKK